MSRESKHFTLRNRACMLFAMFAFGAPSIVMADGDPDNSAAKAEARSSITVHITRGGRDNPQRVSESSEDYDALVTTGGRGLSKTGAGSSKPGAGGETSRSVGNDFWFFDADVILFNDDDGDGYYHGIDLLFDADTIYNAADVYAVMYLSYEGGPWNEYAVTDVFTLFGASSDDEYVLVTELMSGYPTGNYDLLIELFDPFDDAFLASFGPADSSELSFLPLEDFNRDAPPPEVVVVHHGGGGAMDVWLLGVLLILLTAAAARKIRSRRNDTLLRIDAPATIWQDGAATRSRLRQ